jgi:hypothetical protein
MDARARCIWRGIVQRACECFEAEMTYLFCADFQRVQLHRLPSAALGHKNEDAEGQYFLPYGDETSDFDVLLFYPPSSPAPPPDILYN